MSTVTKRDGTREPRDLEKLHKVVQEACAGLTGVSASEIEMRAHLSFYDGIKTTDVQESVIKAAAELISEETPNYQYAAGRLINYHLRKSVYGKFEPDHIFDHVSKYVEKGFYDPCFLTVYTREEWDKINGFIRHDRDDNYTYAAMEQFRGKYLLKNRVTGEIHETPQVCCVLIAAFLFQNYPKETRLRYVKDYYDALTEFDFTLPTPIMAGVRTSQRQFSSCVLIESDDTIDSIFTTSHAVGKYVSQKAGIGINAGNIRPLGAPIRNGDAYSTGVIPYMRNFATATKSCSQGSVRGGAATIYYPMWHMEVEDLLVLKNNEGTEQNRIRQVDYGVQVNRLFYERLITGGNISLFNPRDVPGLYENFHDNDKFKAIYEAAEKNKKIKRKTVSAIEIWSTFATERKKTGRKYLQNIDNCNDHGSFLPEEGAVVRMSNLCTEVTLPTKPLENINDPNGEIALCILSAQNWGNVKSPHDFKKTADLIVRGLDELIDLQSYPILAAEISTRARRSIGVGIINYAYWLAKNDLDYQNITPEGLAMVDEYAEWWSYYLIKASADLAVEKGACEWNSQTKYSRGILPIDTYKKTVDELVPYKSRAPWADLRMQLISTGIRNSTLMCLMPAETSAQIANATNGIEPAKALVTIKQSKDGVLAQVVPEIRRLKNKYDLQWDQKSPIGYLKHMAVLQKHIDQAISVNTSYNPKFYENEEIPMSVIIQDIVFHYKYGGKTLYYFNTYDGAGELDIEAKPSYTSSELPDEADCDSCKI